MARYAEVVFVGNPDDLIRTNERAKASVAATTTSIEASGKRVGGSYVSMSGAGKKAAASLEGSHNKIASSMVGIGRSGNLAVAGIVAVGAAAAGVKKSADTLAELAKETRTLHNVTGLNTKAASAYAAVAKAQDIPVKGLNQAFGTLSKNIHAVENAHHGLTKAAKTQENALRQLGLPMSAITKAHGDLNKLLPQITKRFEEMSGSVQETAIGMALFGRGWQTLVPLMHKGELGMKEQLETAKKMGATLSGSTAQQMKEFAKQQEEAKYASLGLQLAVGQYLAPALTKLVHVEADVTHSLGEGVHWLEKHETAAKAAAGVIGTVLGGALTVFAFSKAKKFVNATKDMVDAVGSLATKVGLRSAEVEGSFAGQATAAETAAGKTAAAQDALAGDIAAADTRIGAANTAAGKSFLKMLAPIAAVVLAIEGLDKILPKGERPENLLGGNQPGEAGREGEVFAKKHGYGGAGGSDMVGGIMGYFMSKGLSAAQAAGIVGNFQQESGLNPNMNTREGRGLDSGTGSRAHGGTAKQQIEAIWKELETTEKATLIALKAAKSPAEAARIFSKRFERPSDPKLSNRERYAREAFKAHPQHHHAAAGGEETEGGNLGYYETAAHKHKKTRDLSSQIDKWAEQSVGKFAESWGKNTGPELDALQKEFHTHAAAWCAEFATTAAMMGGANKAVRTASVATIREWAAQGSHGYRKGISHTPHVGDMMMFGDSHVGFVQSVHGGKVTTIEGNTSAGKVATRTHSVSEGDYASPIYHSLKTGAVLLKQTSKMYEEAVKRAEHLLLTSGQKAFVGRMTAAAKGSHSMAMGFAAEAADIGTTMSALTARWARHPQNLATAAGAENQKERFELVVKNDKVKKKYYERELKALQKEAAQWGKTRDYWRKIARHQPSPKAKKEALDKAAAYEAKVEQAQAAAKELKGTIVSTEAEIEETETAMNVALPEEVAAADLGAYQHDNAKIDAEERAGILTPDQAKKAKEANARKAKEGGYGSLSAEGLLQVAGDLREFEKAVTDSTSAIEAYKQAHEEATKALLEREQAARRLAEVENGTLTKAMADMISGQIGGVNYHGRRMTAGTGTAASY